MARGRPKGKGNIPKQKSAKTKAKGGSGVGADVTKAAKKIFAGKSKGGKQRKSAKLLLKRAYERRAKTQIRIGQLGQARRTLRKKATVV